MAIYIPINKTSEDETSVTYKYRVEIATPAPSSLNNVKQRYDVTYDWGSFRLNKHSGEYEPIDVPSGDDKERCLKRAVVKVWLQWKEEGAFPSETCFAA